MKKSLPNLGRWLKQGWRYAMLCTFTQCFVINLMAYSSNAQDPYEVPVQLNVSETTVAEAFRMIEAKTDFRFTFSSQEVDVEQRIVLSGNEKNVGEILESITRQTNFSFKQINNILVVKKALAKRKAVSAAATGIISGIVSDAQTGERLPGATVQIAGTNQGTVTNLTGEFTLRAPDGNVTLEINYVGFGKVTQEVMVPAGGSVDVEVKMNELAQELDDVVVTGVLQGQQRALNQQKTAENIKNIVSADQIGRFPDPNVAEALQRVPAVNIERDQGEGRYVLVRGLAPQFTNISINGEQVPSPEAGVRYVALDAIPADQLSSIEISKAITPDMDGDAVGGNVNLITRTAQSEKPSIRATALGGYNQLVGRGNFQGSLEMSKRFLDNKLGVMVNSSYYETDRGSHNWERDDEEMELRDYQLVRTRLGLSTTIDYKFNPQNEIYFRGIYNRFTDREQRRRYVLVPNAAASPFEDHEIERLTKDRLEKQFVSSYNFGGRHFFKNVTLDYEIAYAEASQDTPFDVEVASVGAFDDVQINWESDTEFPTFSVNGISHLNASNPFLNNENYEFDELVIGRTLAEDENRTAKFNVGIPYQAGAQEGLFKFGGKVRLKEKSFEVGENVFGWQGGDVTFPGFEAGDYTLNKFEGGPADKFLDGRYIIRPNADVEKVLRHFNENRSGYELDVESKLAAEALESYKATEDVYAGYAMTRIQWSKLMLLGGVRFERTNVSYRSSEVYYDFEGNLDEIVPVEGSTDYSFLLPQLHLKYQIDNFTNLRFAATRSYARPNFEDIVPSQEIDLNGRSASIGNPALKPVGAINLDFLGEHYFGTVGVLSGGIFYKHLSDFIFSRRFETDRYNGRNLGTELEFSQAQNGENARLIGVELAYQQNLSFLPGILKGLSVYANYTYTHSNATIQSRENDRSTEDIRLPGQARNIGNFSLAYDRGRVNVRLSSNFNGRYITEVGGSPDEDLWVNDRVQLDATATITITPQLRLFTEFLNITDQPFEVFQGRDDRYIQREFYSWWTRIGIKFDF